MFLSATQVLNHLNAQLQRSGEPALSESTFYRLRELFPRLYPQSHNLTTSGRIVYDEPLCRWLYFAAKAHARFQSYRLDQLYLQGIDQQLHERGQRFSEAFPSYSAINSYFANFTSSKATA